MPDDSYTTLLKPSRVKLRIKGSRFIVSARATATRREAEEFVESIRREFHDATHNCYAYSAGFPRSEVRASDDGEPSGTAGARILGAIEGRRLHNAAVVVTRYFGGTKLGVGGLSRAYRDAAIQAIKASGTTERFVLEWLRLTFPSDRVGSVMRHIELYHASIDDAAYAEGAVLAVSIRRSHAEAFCHALIDATAGNIEISELPEASPPANPSHA